MEKEYFANLMNVRAKTSSGRSPSRLANADYLDQELARARVNTKKISGYETTVSTHLETGLRILKGEAEVGLAT